MEHYGRNRKLYQQEKQVIWPLVQSQDLSGEFLPAEPSILPESNGVFARELALAGYALVRFGDALDSIFELTASLRQLPGYDVAHGGGSPIREISDQRDSLAGSKLVFCHSAAFPAQWDSATLMRACVERLGSGPKVHRAIW